MNAVAVVFGAPVLVAIALEDLRHHRIRNQHVLVLAALTTVVVSIAAFDGDAAAIRRAGLEAVLGSAPLAAAWVTRLSHIGGGDVKLAAVIGGSSA